MTNVDGTLEDWYVWSYYSLVFDFAPINAGEELVFHQFAGTRLATNALCRVGYKDLREKVLGANRQAIVIQLWRALLYA